MAAHFLRKLAIEGKLEWNGKTYALKPGTLIYRMERNFKEGIENKTIYAAGKKPPESAYVMTRPLAKVPQKPVYVDIDFHEGIPVALNGKSLSLVSLIERLNELGGIYGVGRIDQIENRLVGIKSREVYEAPAATILLMAHAELEGMIFDRSFLHYKKLLSERYSELVYDGLWFSPLKEALDAFFNISPIPADRPHLHGRGGRVDAGQRVGGHQEGQRRGHAHTDGG